MITNLGQLRGTVERWGVERVLAGALAALAAMVLIQGVRLAVIGLGSGGIKRALEKGLAAAPPRASKHTVETYAPILEHGFIGKVAKNSGPEKSGLKLMGVIGGSAMMGTSPKDLTVYKAGDKTPAGDTIVKVRTNEVVLEQDGKERTLQVFPDFKGAAKKPGIPSKANPPENAPPKGAPNTASPGAMIGASPHEMNLKTR